MSKTNYIKIEKSTIEAQLDVFIYEKDDMFFAYAPALDLVGYGRTIEGAKDSFEIVIEDFFEFGLKRGTLEEDLKKHGWEKEGERQFGIPNIWLILAQDKNARAVSANDFQKVSVPFKHEMSFC